MGSACSSISQLDQNDYLHRFCGRESITPNDPFWNQFLAFKIKPPLTRSNAEEVDKLVSKYYTMFSSNNKISFNLYSLIKVFTRRSGQLLEANESDPNGASKSFFIGQVCNTLFVLRQVLKYLMEYTSTETLVEHLSTATNTDETSTEIIDVLMETLFCLLIEIESSDECYGLHLESLVTLLVLFSSQIFTSDPASHIPLYQVALTGKCSKHACLIVKRLLQNFIDYRPTPTSLFEEEKSNSLIYDVTTTLATGLLSVVTLGYSGRKSTPSLLLSQSVDASSEDARPSEPDTEPHILADHSLLFVLVLANHCVDVKELKNPYRTALLQSRDSRLPSQGGETMSSAFSVDFSDLHSRIISLLHRDHSLLILYLLMYKNDNYKQFLKIIKQLENTLIPLLQILHSSPHSSTTSHQFYMALILLLIFTEDNELTLFVHGVKLTSVSWIVEHDFTDVSLGSLVVYILIRTILQNLHNLRDMYLHRNCLAALSNMSSRFNNLNAYVSQKLMSLVVVLAKKHVKMVERIGKEAVVRRQNGDASNLSSADDHNKNKPPNEADSIEELGLLEDIIRTVIEVINSSMTHCLDNNPHFIYSLLHQQEAFNSFRFHPSFQELMQNIDMIMALFTAKLTPEHSTEHSVMNVIRSNATAISKSHSFKKWPEPKFQYVEDEHPEDFFVPCLWSLVCRVSLLFYNANSIPLFTLQTPSAPLHDNGVLA